MFRQVGAVGVTDTSFAALRNPHYSHPISPNTPVLTVRLDPSNSLKIGGCEVFSYLKVFQLQCCFHVPLNRYLYLYAQTQYTVVANELLLVYNI